MEEKGGGEEEEKRGKGEGECRRRRPLRVSLGASPRSRDRKSPSRRQL